MKSNDKKKKELKKKSDGTSTKVQSDYQQDKTQKVIIEPSPFKQKK